MKGENEDWKQYQDISHSAEAFKEQYGGNLHAVDSANLKSMLVDFATHHANQNQEQEKECEHEFVWQCSDWTDKTGCKCFPSSTSTKPTQEQEKEEAPKKYRRRKYGADTVIYTTTGGAVATIRDPEDAKRILDLLNGE